MRQKHLQQIREKCIEANPEKWGDVGSWKRGWICGLADVLLAVQKILGKYDDVKLYVAPDVTELIIEYGTYDGEGDSSFLIPWNLRKTLEEQSDDTLAFLAQLLYPTKE